MFLLLILRLIFLRFFSMSVRHEATFINGKTKIPPGGTPRRLAPGGGIFTLGVDGTFPRLRCGLGVGRSAAFHVRSVSHKNVCFFFKAWDTFRTRISGRAAPLRRYVKAHDPFVYSSLNIWPLSG